MMTGWVAVVARVGGCIGVLCVVVVEGWEETTGLYDSWDTIIGKVESVSGGCRWWMK